MWPSQNLPLRPRTYPPPLFTNYMRPSQNLPLPEYTTLFNKCICATLPESPPSQNIPLFNNYVRPSENWIYPLFNNYMRSSQNIPLPLRIYPPFQQMYICATLPEYTPPYQNTPPFSTTKCDPPRIYPLPLPEYTPLFNNYIIMRHSQNLSLPEYTPSLSTTICDTLRNYPFLREYPPPFVRQLYAPSRLRIYPSSPLYNYMRYSKNIPLSHWIWPLF